MSPMPPMTGCYNIPKERGSPYIYHRTIPRFTSHDVFEKESMRLVELLRSTITRFLLRHQIPEYNDTLESVFGEHSIGEFPSERTMCFFLQYLDAFTPEMVELLQDRVLSVYPYWRLRAQYDSSFIGIYPSGAWLGEQWVEKGFLVSDDSYQNWLKLSHLADEKRYGPHRRQLRYLSAMLPRVVTQLPERGYLHLATFDRYPPHVGNYAVWILQKEYSNDHLLRIDSSAIATHPLELQGAIQPQYSQRYYPSTKKRPAFWLVCYLVKPVTPATYQMEDFNTKRILGPVHIKKVIKDRDLKKHMQYPKIHKSS